MDYHHHKKENEAVIQKKKANYSFPFPEFCQTPTHPCVALPNPNSLPPNSSQMVETEDKDGITARKTQKADREKLRRDRLNEQFVELGNVLDSDRPKHNKITILVAAIQMLKDLTSQIRQLKDEHANLSEESSEFTQEKNDLRDEKESLKSDVEKLNVQYQQRTRAAFPWTAVDHSVIMAQPSYPFSVPMAMAPGPIPMHPHIQPYPIYANQNSNIVPNPCSMFGPYLNPNTQGELQPVQHPSPAIVYPAIQANVSGKQDHQNKLPAESMGEYNDDSKDATTDLEFKTPVSSAEQDLSSGLRVTRNHLSKSTAVQKAIPPVGGFHLVA